MMDAVYLRDNFLLRLAQSLESASHTKDDLVFEGYFCIRE